MDDLPHSLSLKGLYMDDLPFSLSLKGLYTDDLKSLQLITERDFDGKLASITCF